MASWQIGNNALNLAASSDLVNQSSLTCVCSMIASSFGVVKLPNHKACLACNDPNRWCQWRFLFMDSGLQLGARVISSLGFDAWT
jgi:hypothetical protein